MARVHFPRKIVEELIEQAQQSPGMEICGLIGGIDNQPTRIYPIDNVAENPELHFLLDAKQQIDTMRHMREKGETLFAIYHSHPNGSPKPSQEDIKKAAYPDTLYLIISPVRTPQMNGYYINEGNVDPVDINVE